MSTENTENASTDSENDPWDPQALRGLVPSTLGSDGSRALICAIRNPDATTGQVAEKCGLTSTYTVENALRSAVQDAERGEVQYGQAQERRGSARDAESYAELTDKQQAIIDFAAENPEFTEDRTWADVAQAIQEQVGTVVNETYVGQVLRKYPEILHRQKALALADSEADEYELEDALSEMTMREVLEAAGYDLPSENLDSMPEASLDSSQATLGDSREAADEFQPGSEVAEDEQEQEDVRPLSDEWLAQHSGIPGASVANLLPEDADEALVKNSTPYWGYVNGVATYGVFVSLTYPEVGVDDVSGLVPEENLYGTRSEVERGDPLVVELENKSGGLSFLDWRLTHPEDVLEQQEAEGTEQEQEQEQDEQPDAGETPEDEDWHVATAQELLELHDITDSLVDLQEAVDTLREGTVFASEMREFADEVEGRLDEQAEDWATLDERLDALERTVENSVAADTVEQAEQNAQTLATLQEAVNALGEQVEQATGHGTALGRVLEDVQRLQGQEATLASYQYEQEQGHVTLHVEADLPDAQVEQLELLEAAAQHEDENE